MLCWTYDDKIIGEDVVIHSCEAQVHGDNPGCVCELIGTQVRVKGRNQEDDPEGIPSYHVAGMDKFVRRREVEVVKRSSG